MANLETLVTNGKTSLSAEEAIVRAVQFFSTEKWKATSQSSRTVTFQGKPPVPWVMLLLTILAFLACVIPGIIMYIVVFRKYNRFFNLVVTANPIQKGTEVSVSHPGYSAEQVNDFLKALPPWSA